MLIHRLFHDLTVRIVVLGWIYAKKPRKTPPKGHNFQVNPPVQARLRPAWVGLSASESLQVIFGAITVAALCQYLAWRRSPKS